MAGLVLLVLLLALGAAAAAGRTTDSRDPRYGVGPLLSRPAAPRSDEVRDNSGCRETETAEAC